MPFLRSTSLSLFCVTAFAPFVLFKPVQAQIIADSNTVDNAAWVGINPSQAKHLTHKDFPALSSVGGAVDNAPILSQASSPDTVPANQPETVPASASSSETPSESVPLGGFLLNPALLNGERISEVIVYLENPADDGDRNQQYQQQTIQAFAVRAGDSYNQLFLDRGLQRVEQLSFVESAQYALYEVQIPGEVVVVISVQLAAEAAVTPTETGIFVTGDWREFPNLYTSDRATAVAILRGGVSNFTSDNTWFRNADTFTQGNPLARDPAGSGTYSWFDSYLELGVAGITQIDTIPLYVYGGLSNLVSATLQPDLFESDNRIFSSTKICMAALFTAIAQTIHALALIYPPDGRITGLVMGCCLPMVRAMGAIAPPSSPTRAQHSTVL